jgi:RND family efflux transporter MFP subunit
MGFVISAPVKQIAVKAGDEVKAGQTLIVLNTPELELSVTGTEASVRSAQAEDQYWSFPRKNEPPERRWVSTAQLQEAQASLDAAKAILSQGTLVAPFDGTIVAINVAEGQLVQLGQVVAVIGDLNHLQVETTDLSERDIAGVQIGQTATVRLKAFNQDLAGKVTAIAPLGVKSSGDVVYKVTIELDAPPQGLMWGMSGDVDIQTK